jgi:MFS transporter, AAHS family, 4-hydroxybenzoate transporter
VKSVTADRMTHAFDIGKALDEGAWRSFQKFVVFLAALTIIFDGIDNQLLGLAIPSIMREWSVPRPAFANVAALGFVGMMIGGALGGVVGDRLGRRFALIGSMLTFGSMTVAASQVDSIAALALARFLVGVGLGGALPNAAALSSEFVPRRYRPFAITLTIVCIPLGGMLAGVFAERTLPTLGWRGMFAVGGLVPFVVAFLLLRLLPESPRYLARHPGRKTVLLRLLRRLGHDIPDDATVVDSSDVSDGRDSLRTVLGPTFRHDTLALWGAYLSCLLAVYLGFTWVPSMLTSAGLSSLANTGLAVFNLGGVIGAIVGSLVITKRGSRVTMAVMTIGAIAGALVMRSMTLGASTSIVPVVAMLTLTGGLINAVQTTMYGLAAHIYPTSARATGVGAAAGIGRAGAILSTYAGAWALDTGGSRLFFALIAAAMLLTLASLMAIRRHIPGKVW